MVGAGGPGGVSAPCAKTLETSQLRVESASKASTILEKEQGLVLINVFGFSLFLMILYLSTLHHREIQLKNGTYKVSPESSPDERRKGGNGAIAGQ